MSSSATSQRPSPPARRNPHLAGNLTSMVLSTVVVAAMVLAFYALVARPDKVARPAVDAHAVVVAQRAATGLPLAELPSLGRGWAPTVASLTPGTDGLSTWQVRYVSAETYVAVYQAAKATDDWVAERVKGRTKAGAMTTAGVPVESYTAGSACTLVRRGGAGLTTVVESSQTCDQVAAYAGGLTPALR